ncbi:MAG: hypothetical protein MJE68_21750 [Proteobacteria bacterium]|nr:hypothetical protein [Pseudomonadota bacterium]
MPCYEGVIENRQIIFVCHVANPLSEDGKKPASIQEMRAYRALLDTGAQLSMLTQKVVDNEGLFPIGTDSIVGVGGVIANRPHYLVDIHLTVPHGVSQTDEDGQQEAAVFERPFHEVTLALLQDIPYSFDILLGMDILEKCYLSLHGKRFTICI